MTEIIKQAPPIVWTIGHADSGSGGGIQADLQTFHDFNVYGCSVITAIVAQNSFARGYSLATERKSVAAQINALDSDLPAKVIKLGALPNAEVLASVANYLEDFNGSLVYDLELASCPQLLSEAGAQLREQILPRVDLLIANTQEVLALVDITIDSEQTMQAAATALLALGPTTVFITGAQFSSHPARRVDYWSAADSHYWLLFDALDTAHNRGGGSVLSAVIAAMLAHSDDIEAALKMAKAYVTQGIRGSHQLGSGPGCIAHLGRPADSSDQPALLAVLS